MRKAKSKVRKAFACNKPGSEEYARLVEEYSSELETYAAFEEYMNGKEWSRKSPEDRMEAICMLLS